MKNDGIAHITYTWSWRSKLKSRKCSFFHFLEIPECFCISFNNSIWMCLNRGLNLYLYYRRSLLTTAPNEMGLALILHKKTWNTSTWYSDVSFTYRTFFLFHLVVFWCCTEMRSWHERCYDRMENVVLCLHSGVITLTSLCSF